MQPHSTLRHDRQDPEVRAPVQPAVEDGQRSMTGRRIVCAACGHPITTERQRIEVNGRHEHRCVNPDGVLFHIGCFHRAPGCVTQGVPTTAFTWFPGFAWTYALCAVCSTLLGWQYQGVDASSFFGLILNRLTTAHERPH
jgi:hypothetical protein